MLMFSSSRFFVIASRLVLQRRDLGPRGTVMIFMFVRFLTVSAMNLGWTGGVGS